MSGNFLAFGNTSLSWLGAHVAVYTHTYIGLKAFVLKAKLGIEGVLIYIRYLVAIDNVAPRLAAECVSHLGIGVGVRQLQGQLHAPMTG